MKTFTVFCQQANGQGTIWISTVQARNVASAGTKAIKACAEDWGWSKRDHENIHLLGIAAGDVEILEWNDLPEY